MTILRYSLWIQGLSVCLSVCLAVHSCLSVYLFVYPFTCPTLQTHFSLSYSGRHKQEESLFEEMLQVSQAIVSYHQQLSIAVH